MICREKCQRFVVEVQTFRPPLERKTWYTIPTKPTPKSRTSFLFLLFDNFCNSSQVDAAKVDSLLEGKDCETIWRGRRSERIPTLNPFALFLAQHSPRPTLACQTFVSHFSINGETELRDRKLEKVPQFSSEQSPIHLLCEATVRMFS